MTHHFGPFCRLAPSELLVFMCNLCPQRGTLSNRRHPRALQRFGVRLRTLHAEDRRIGTMLDRNRRYYLSSTRTAHRWRQSGAGRHNGRCGRVRKGTSSTNPRCCNGIENPSSASGCGCEACAQSTFLGLKRCDPIGSAGLAANDDP